MIPSPIIIGNNFTRLENKVVEFARNAIKKCPPDNKSFHCAVLTYKGIIISYGINKELINENLNFKYQYRTVHAEFDCLRRFRRTNLASEINKLDLYSIRITRRGLIKNARPCRICSQIIINNKPRKVFHTTDNGDIIEWQN